MIQANRPSKQGVNEHEVMEGRLTGVIAHFSITLTSKQVSQSKGLMTSCVLCTKWSNEGDWPPATTHSQLHLRVNGSKGINRIRTTHKHINPCKSLNLPITCVQTTAYTTVYTYHRDRYTSCESCHELQYCMYTMCTVETLSTRRLSNEDRAYCPRHCTHVQICIG